MLTHLTSMMRRLSGLAALTALLAGVPWALVHFLGDTLPDRVPTVEQVTAALSSPLTDTILGGLLVSVLWVAWAAFAWSVIAEFAAVLAGIRLPQPRAFAPTRGVAAVLVAAITGGVLATAAQAAPPAAANAAVRTAPAVSVVVAAPQTMPAAAAKVLAAPAHREATAIKSVPERVTLLAAGKKYTYTVKPGDNLSAIAKAWLGDANRWPEVFALNRGHHFSAPDGTLSDPKVIRPGWTLELPDDATPPVGVHADADDENESSATDVDKAEKQEPVSVAPAAGTDPQAADPQTVAGDDGVIDTGADAPVDDEQQAPATPAPTGVSLPSGSWVDAGLVVALLAAVALVWAHRHRRYRRRTIGTEHLDDPMPPVVSHVRRGLRRAAEELDTASLRELREHRAYFDKMREADGAPELTRPRNEQRIDASYRFTDGELLPDAPTSDHGQPRRELPPVPATAYSDADADVDNAFPMAARHQPDDSHAPAEPFDGFDVYGDDDLLEREPVDMARLLASVPPPVTPALANPIAAAWPSAGIGLTGPGAEAAARGFLVAALAAGGIDDFDARTWVVIPATTLATLLGADAVSLPQTPRLSVTAGLTEALELVEEQTLHRTRVLYDYEVEDATALRESDPMAEPMPPLVLFADADAGHEQARIAALLTQSQRLDIHGVLLGAWPQGDTVEVGIGGSTTAVGAGTRHRAHLADQGRLTVLTHGEAADLLRLLGESHTGEPQPAAPVEHHLGTNDENADFFGQSPPDDGTIPAADPHQVAGQSTPLADAARTRDTGHDGTDDARSTADTPAADTTDTDTVDQVSSAPADSVLAVADPVLAEPEPVARERVAVHVFGRPTIADVPADERLRPQALEVLVYLACHGGTASQDEILEDLFPEMNSKGAPNRLHTFASNLRRVAGVIAGPGDYLTVQRKQYRLHRDAFDIDLWRLQDAVHVAAKATDPAERTAALRRVVEVYTAPLADTDNGYDWAEPARETVRRQALNAALTLADELDDDAEALAVLDEAMQMHPYAEELYRSAMRRHAARADLDALRRVQRTLTERLNDLDTEPSDDTLALIDALVADLRRQSRTAGKPSERRS